MYLLLDLYLLWFPSKHLIPLGHSQPSWICVQVSACIGIGRIGIGGGTIWDRIAVTTGGRFSTQCLRAVAFSLSAIISKVIDKISSWNFFWSASSSIRRGNVLKPSQNSKPRNLEQKNHIPSRDNTFPMAERLAPRDLDSSVSRMNAACHFKWPPFTPLVELRRAYILLYNSCSKWFHSLVNLNIQRSQSTTHIEVLLRDSKWYNVILSPNASPLACGVR